MKNLNKQIQLKYLVLFSILVFIFLFISYAIIKTIILNPSNESSTIISLVGIVFAILGISIFLIAFGTYYFLKKQNNLLEEDMNLLSNYIVDISQKKYKSSIVIKNYLELLQISLTLKNIVKRLKKRD